ncbi:thiolase family protein [Ramlibacter rhizophilus]|uniref:Thiolase family protein n=1 Tax=Ramlibacter rhizophilus TaxID=1781167 RepID=A0A4Z0BPR9_9BURK|nr:thiolase family protein [Ramlibacter rhizophilus]TFZ01316.1 thiolase family protein [Ramlibacter rhizophilus]
MQFEAAYIPAPLMWSSPFVRWQGATADVSSLDLAVQVTRDALAARRFDGGRVGQLVYGSTVPQAGSFYAAPLIAARLGLAGVGGPTVAQACATSVACVAQAAAASQLAAGELQLVVTADRISNGPLLVYPRSAGMGGAPQTEHWVLDSFAADPWTGESMVHTAEATASDGGFTRAQCDELTLLRFSQYQRALADDRRAQRAYFQPIVIRQRKGERVIEADEGVADYSAEGLAALKPSLPGGVTTPGTQTHPADGAAGLVVCGREDARALAGGEGVVRLLAAGFARAEKGRMPKAPALAAQRALASAGRNAGELAAVVTHNPFAVNDLWLSQQLGIPLERMNALGCSLIYGHPQGPTGMRGIVELVQALRAQGGGLGLFTGCAAGDMGAALLLSVQ